MSNPYRLWQFMVTDTVLNELQRGLHRDFMTWRYDDGFTGFFALEVIADFFVVVCDYAGFAFFRWYGARAAQEFLRHANGWHIHSYADMGG